MSGSERAIREVLEANGRLSVSALTLRVNDDLYQHGLTSHASVSVMLGLENAFDFEFPDALLRRDTFKSVAAIQTALASLGVGEESSDRA
jgi:acyl carrier protein